MILYLCLKKAKKPAKKGKGKGKAGAELDDEALSGLDRTIKEKQDLYESEKAKAKEYDNKRSAIFKEIDIIKSMDINKMVLELVDETVERKYVKTKLGDRASSFLSEKGRYYLAEIVAGMFGKIIYSP